MNTIEAHSTLIDERGNIYEINHNSKFAKLIETGAPPFHELVKRNGQVNVKGYETVNGFECAVRSILVNGEPGGKEYLYIPYGLLVKTEWTTDGGSHWMVRELYDIQIAEPDPASVQIPEGYAIVNDKPVEEHH